MLPYDSAIDSRPAQSFLTTHWSIVLTAGDSSPAGQRALEELYVTYWQPLYAYVRRRGHTRADAQDLTQEFFVRMLERKYLRLFDRERGRFRTFLLTSLKHFLINEWAKVNRQKRGGGQKAISLDVEMAESRFAAEPAVSQPSETLYDRNWAGVLMKNALLALRAEFSRAGKLDAFERLKGFVWGDKNALPYAEMAAQLGATEGATKVAVHRLRKRYGELLRAEIMKTVATPVEVDEELRYLLAVVRTESANTGNFSPESL